MLRRTAILLLLLVLIGCSAKTGGQDNVPILDLVNLPQDAGVYHGMEPDDRLLSEKAQNAAWSDFLYEHFGPWHRRSAKHTAEEVFWALDVYKNKQLFGENMLLRDPAWMEEMRANSRVDSYPSMGRKAVAVTNANLRALPTNLPAFYDFQKAGEGFPFDYMQNSLILAGTPLFATHISEDRRWVLVESRHAYGWMETRDIGWATKRFIKDFEIGTYGAVVRDQTPVMAFEAGFTFMAEVGTILPMKGRKIYIPIRNKMGDADTTLGRMPEGAIQPAPIAATPRNFAALANQMLGRPYGWGGYYGHRDCSAATMDLMAAFGIYLPRNSSQQIKFGTHVDLTELDREAKKQRVVEEGTPFLTLVRKPGHIMLYIGQKDGQPIVLHSAWGLKTETRAGYGRKIIGSTVITTLEPGIERKDLARPGGDYLESVQAISTLP